MSHLAFYQREETLVYADVMPDMQPPEPAQDLNEKKQMQIIFRSLSQESPRARSAFLLVSVEGFEPHEIAWMQDRREEQVRSDIERCEDPLQKALSSRN